MRQIEYFDLPSHWASPLINGDYSGMSEEDERALDAFTEEMVRLYGQCCCVDISQESYFTYYHDATGFGVGGTDCYRFTFDISKERRYA